MTTSTQTLQQQLDNQAAQFTAKVPDAVKKEMKDTDERLAQWLATQDTMTVGDSAPGFTLPDPQGNTVQLSKMLEQGPVVLSFYRGGWCPYCNLELRGLQAALPDFREQGAQLIAVSPQTPDSSLTTQEQNELEFPVLSDTGNAVARKFELVFTLPESLRPIYKDFGIDIQESNGEDTFELPVPATFVINRNSEITYAFINADYKKRAEPADVLAALKD